MTLIVVTTGDEIHESEAPLLDGIMPGSVDCKGRPSIRSKSGCWKSSPFIIGAAVSERAAYYGISLNLVSYLTGKLGQSTATAAAMLNAWFGVASLLPILGATIADSFLGRFHMIIVGCVLYISGLSFLTLSASINSLECKHAMETSLSTTCSPSHLQLLFFFFSLYLVALAQGGFSPCIQAFGADQFDDSDENECRAKSSFFNWWYCVSVGGIMIPLLILTYIQEYVSWELGFGLPAAVMLIALILFLFGVPSYRFRQRTQTANPFVRIVRVYVKAAKNWKVEDFPISVEHNHQMDMPPLGQASNLRFLEKALHVPDGTAEHDKFCSINDVEDAKGILRLVPIWFACLGYSIVYAQPATLFTKQANTVDRHLISGLEVPAASLQQCFIAIPITVTLTFYDRVFVPIARAITKKASGISMLQRIATGLTLSLISMIFAAFVEVKRKRLAREYGLVDTPGAIIPMNVWWLAPQYLLSGIADVFAMVGLLEFFYDQVPAELKSVGMGLYASILGIGSLVSSFLVSAIQNATVENGQGGWFANNLNRAHLDYFYLVLAGISTVELVCFVTYAKWFYVYRSKNGE